MKKAKGEDPASRSNYTDGRDSIRENLRVVVRVRPVPQEVQRVVNLDPVNPSVIRILSRDKKGQLEFRLSHIFAEESSQQEVYDYVKPMLEDVVNGMNTTVFAYGQTGTGKTYTMLGKGLERQLFGSKTQEISASDNILASDNECDQTPRGLRVKEVGWGIIPRAVRDLFDRLGSVATAAVHCSYMQIYQEKLFDLLRDKQRQKSLPIRETVSNGHRSVYVQGLSEYRVGGPEDVFNLLHQGTKNRVQRSTDYNSASSRSHAILQLSIEVELPEQHGRRIMRRAKLNLVDLAGSEKWGERQLTQTGAENEAKELRAINSSLSALGNCISALTEKKRSHIPYRDSMLTRLLQDSLGGSTRTIIIATIDPAIPAQEESASTLQFANRATQITARLKVNEVVNDAVLLQRAKREIEKLRKLLAQKDEKEQQQSQASLQIESDAEIQRKEHLEQAKEWQEKYEHLLSFHAQQQSSLAEVVPDDDLNLNAQQQIYNLQESQKRNKEIIRKLQEQCVALEMQLKEEQRQRTSLETQLAKIQASSRSNLRSPSSSAADACSESDITGRTRVSPSPMHSRRFSDSEDALEDSWMFPVCSKPLQSPPKKRVPSLIPRLNLFSSKSIATFEATSPAAGGSGAYIVRALYDFDGEQQGDLKFSANQLIEVVDRNDDGWWTGFLKGDSSKRTGTFPSNFVKTGPMAGTKDLNPTVTQQNLFSICNSEKMAGMAGSDGKEQMDGVAEMDPPLSILSASSGPPTESFPAFQNQLQEEQQHQQDKGDDVPQRTPSHSPLLSKEAILNQQRGVQEGKCERHGLMRCLLCAMQKNQDSPFKERVNSPTKPRPTPVPGEPTQAFRSPSVAANALPNDGPSTNGKPGVCNRHGLQRCVLCSMPSFSNAGIQVKAEAAPLPSPLDAYQRSKAAKLEAFPTVADCDPASTTKKEGEAGGGGKQFCSRHGLANCLLCSRLADPSVLGPTKTLAPPCPPKQLPEVQSHRNLSDAPQRMTTKVNINLKRQEDIASKPSGIYYEDDGMLNESQFSLHIESEGEEPQYSPSNLMKKGQQKLSQKHISKLSPSHKGKFENHAGQKRVEQQGSPVYQQRKGTKSKKKSQKVQKLAQQSAYYSGSNKKSVVSDKKAQKLPTKKKQNTNSNNKIGKPKGPRVTSKHDLESDVQHLYLAKQAILAASSILDEDGPA